MIGYKVVNGNLTAFNGFQYEIGKIYDTKNERPRFCKDLHFFERLEDTENLINRYDTPKILVIDSLDSKVKTPTSEPEIRVSTKLKIVKELDYASVESQNKKSATYFALIRAFSKKKKYVREYTQRIKNEVPNIMIPFNYVFYDTIKENIDRCPKEIFEIVKMSDAYWITKDFLRRTRSKIFANALLKDEKTRETLIMSCSTEIIKNLCDDDLVDKIMDDIDSDYAIAKIIEAKKSRKYIEKYIYSNSKNILETILNVGTKEDIDFIVTKRLTTITTENAYALAQVAAKNPNYIEPFFNKAYKDLNARITYYRAIILYAEKALIPRIYKMLKTREPEKILEEVLTSLLLRGVVSINKKYMNDKRQNIRSIVADSNKYFADRMYKDRSPHVRMACAGRCSKKILKILMHDENTSVLFPCVDRLNNKDLDFLCENVKKPTLILYILESRNRKKDLIRFANHPSKIVRRYILKQGYRPAIKILAKGNTEEKNHTKCKALSKNRYAPCIKSERKNHAKT